MFDNFKLPLCLKCGDTKHVVTEWNGYEEVHRCTRCNIEWSAESARMTDENGVEHYYNQRLDHWIKYE